MNTLAIASSNMPFYILLSERMICYNLPYLIILYIYLFKWHTVFSFNENKVELQKRNHIVGRSDCEQSDNQDK